MDNKTSFDEFNLGPLTKQELVYEYFKFPIDKDIPEITTLDVFKHLRTFSQKHYKRSNDKDKKEQINLEDFLNSYIEKYNYDTPYATGIRIQSIALAVKVGEMLNF